MFLWLFGWLNQGRKGSSSNIAASYDSLLARLSGLVFAEHRLYFVLSLSVGLVGSRRSFGPCIVLFHPDKRVVID